MGGPGRIAPDLALPHADHRPPGRGQQAVVSSVAASVRADLLPPALCIRALELGRRVVGASMPEAAIDEYGHLPPGKHEVRRALGDDTAVETETKSERVDGAAQLHLGPGVPGDPAPEMGAFVGRNPL